MEAASVVFLFYLFCYLFINFSLLMRRTPVLVHHTHITHTTTHTHTHTHTPMGQWLMPSPATRQGMRSNLLRSLSIFHCQVLKLCDLILFNLFTPFKLRVICSEINDPTFSVLRLGYLNVIDYTLMFIINHLIFSIKRETLSAREVYQ